ncbi:hypothetical protein ACWGCW_09215 [Streptomyces sp. NPDC054933]
MREFIRGIWMPVVTILSPASVSRACHRSRRLATRSDEGAVGVGEDGLADLALQDEQLVPEREDLDVL